MQKQKTSGKWLVVIFFLLLGVIYFSKADHHYGWTSKELKDSSPVISDGAGYYAWMPSWFIYSNSSFKFLHSVQKKYPQSHFGDILYGNKNAVNKYYTGTAVALSPFFLTAHSWASAGNYDADGYSFPYMFMTGIGCLFYFLAGCLGVYFFLRTFEIRRIWAVAVITCLAFGTNLEYYSFIYIPYSHVFSFAVNAWILYLSRRWIASGSVKHLLLISALLGLAFIIRPTNMLVIVLIPFMFPSKNALKERFISVFRNAKILVPSLACFFVFVVFQLLQVHYHTGSWSLNTYSGEGFSSWNSPEIINVLFSWGKGLFIYAPVLLLVIPGLVVLYIKKLKLFYGTSLFLVLATFVISSWWCWWYGGGLGMRPFIDFFPVFALPLAMLFEVKNLILRILTIFFALVSIQVYQVYEFQMKNNILDYELMTYDQYSYVFMKKGLRYGWWTRQKYEHLPSGKPVEVVKLSFHSSDGTFRSGNDKLSKENPADNPFIVVRSNETLTNRFFGMKLSGEFYISSEDATPCYETTYWKNGSAVKQDKFYFGQFFKKEKQYEEMKMELFPGLKYTEFDSLKVEFQEGNTFAGAKNLKAVQLSFSE